MITIPRRRFLQGLVGIIAAPAIVRITSLMPISPLTPYSSSPLLSSMDDIIRLLKQQNDLFGDVPPLDDYIIRTQLPIGTWRILNQGASYDR